MIKTEEKEVSYSVAIPETKTKKIIIYTCSDGKQFTNENDKYNGYKKGKELAEEHEAYMAKQDIAKKEFKFHSINSDKEYNHEYEPSFCFYYKSDLSKETINVLYQLVFDFSKHYNKGLVEGWYLVEQYVHEIPLNSRNCAYECDGYFGLLTDVIQQKENSLNSYKELLKNIRNK